MYLRIQVTLWTFLVFYTLHETIGPVTTIPAPPSDGDGSHSGSQSADVTTAQRKGPNKHNEGGSVDAPTVNTLIGNDNVDATGALSDRSVEKHDSLTGVATTEPPNDDKEAHSDSFTTDTTTVRSDGASPSEQSVNYSSGNEHGGRMSDGAGDRTVTHTNGRTNAVIPTHWLRRPIRNTPNIVSANTSSSATDILDTITTDATLSSNVPDTQEISTGDGMSTNITTYVTNTVATVPSSRPSINNSVGALFKGVITEISVENYWRSIVPKFNSLCPHTEYCGLNHLDDSVTTSNNSCCGSCSCDISCQEHQQCCHDDENSAGLNNDKECLKPIIWEIGSIMKKHMISTTHYRFVVAMPKGGCVNEDDLDVTPGPDDYTTLKPVYSQHLMLNYKNEYIARCHGARDITPWSATILFKGNINSASHAFTQYYSTFRAPGIHVKYEPPFAESEDIIHACFKDVVETCPSEKFHKFTIPVEIKMDREEIAEACERGPRALYLKSLDTAYRNVFCAICNSFAYFDRVVCRLKPRNNRFSSFSLRGLLDIKSVALVDAVKKPVHEECYRKKNDSTGSNGCATLKCPLMQARSTNGRCVYLCEQLDIDCKYVLIQLNLTATTANVNSSVLLTMDGDHLYYLVQSSSPWQGCWKIEIIGVRIDINVPELFVQLACMISRINIRRMNQMILYDLQKLWTVMIDGRGVLFTQEINRHGVIANVHSGREINGIPVLDMVPLWSMYVDPTVIHIPRWNMVFRRQLHECLMVTKLFFCEQIELGLGEFVPLTLSGTSPIYVPHDNKYLYPAEYSIFDDEAGLQTARVCVEDAAYVMVPSEAQSARFSVTVVFTTWYASIFS